MDLLIILGIAVVLIIGIVLIEKFMLKAPAPKQIQEAVPKEPSVIPVNTFIPPAKHICTRDPILDMNGQVKAFKCPGCNKITDA